MWGCRYTPHPLFFLFLCLSWVAAQQLQLHQWRLISSTSLGNVTGCIVSLPTYQDNSWFSTEVPTTVLAAILENDEFSFDPFYGINLQNISGAPFDVTWWYRTTFELSTTPSSNITLIIHGSNYFTNVWVNGQLVATNSTVVGAFRRFDLDITHYYKSGAQNAIALEIRRPNNGVFAPYAHTTDLALSFIDWAPNPPDSNMGLWKPAFVSVTGPVSVRSPMVATVLSADSSIAHLTVMVVATSHLSSSATSGIMQITIIPPDNSASIMLKQRVTIPQPLQELQVIFSNNSYIELNIIANNLWWPWQMGSQPLYILVANFISDGGSLSDSLNVTFGIREVTSELDSKNYLLFRVNKKPILIRGGGYAPDLFQRVDPAYQEAEFQYVRHMGLNTIRLEGHLAQDSFYDLADQYGILLLPGIPCCDSWQHWSDWTQDTYYIAQESIRSQVQRMRIRPSILGFFYSSDDLPPVNLEQIYLNVFKDEMWPNPTIAAAGEYTSKITGDTGVKMSGPYSWVPPNYWLEDTTQFGGAYGFLTEGGPGEAPLSFESFTRAIPPDHMWPMDSYWDWHCGNPQGVFRNLRYFTPPLYARYGVATSAIDYLKKSQVAAYEGLRAMFEGYSRNKYTFATGVIQWMLNNAWPENIWHLYDYYLNVPGTYFGAKKGCEDLHPQYSYTDRSIWVVNSLYAQTVTFSIIAKVYNIDGSLVYTHSQLVSGGVGPDSATNLFTLPQLNNVTTTYFVFLYLYDSSSALITDNVYWLSTKPDVLDWKNSTFYNTACTTYADFTLLQKLPPVSLSVKYSTQTKGNLLYVNVLLDNPTNSVAFFTRLRITDLNGDDILPIFWTDNYITIAPQASRNVTAHFDSNLITAFPILVVELYNNLQSISFTVTK